MPRFVRAFGVLVITACCAVGGPRTVQAQSATAEPPPFALGDFEDDYGNHFTITESEWTLHQSARYMVERWIDGAVILQNHAANPSEPGLWTRIDFVMMTHREPWTWAFCMTVYDAPSAEAAQATPAPDLSSIRTSCNGFPFSRMKPVTHRTLGAGTAS